MKKLVIITIPAIAVAALVFMVGVEAWVRVTWNPKRGTPGLFVADPIRGERFTPDYTGWFAGVPVHINNLGFRDPRNYDLAKGPKTFRIIVLGDSVTFGHASVYEHTWPYLLEQQLKKWKPDVDWQVWNLGVPGYNTRQELSHLKEVGPQFHPDLVIVGFFENDLVDNRDPGEPGFARRTATGVIGFAQRHLYSFDLYKKVALRLAWKFSRSSSADAYRQHLEQIADDEKLLITSADASLLKQQDLTPVDYVSDEDIVAHCPSKPKPTTALVDAAKRQEGFDEWVAAVREFQKLNDSGAYRIVFFLNMPPAYCPDGDTFFDEGPTGLNAFLLDVMSKGTPAVSSHDAFLHRRPSQMPAANGHSLGNSNVVKAGALFEYLRDHVLAR